MYEHNIPFLEKAKIIHLAQVKKQENKALFRKLEMMGANGQEVIFNQLEENNEIIDAGEKELEDLIAGNLILVLRGVYKYTSDEDKRLSLIKEGNKKMREMLTNYDYADVSDFQENVRNFLAEFLPV